MAVDQILNPTDPTLRFKVISRYKEERTRRPASIFKSWNLELFTPALRKRWYDYTQSSDYRGSDERVAVANRSIPVAERLREWVNLNQIGVAATSGRPTSRGTTERMIEYKAEIKPDVPYLMDGLQTKCLLPLQKREILHSQASKPAYEGYIEIVEIFPDEEIEVDNSGIFPIIISQNETKPDEKPLDEQFKEMTNTYDKMKITELRRIAKERSIQTPFGITKADLITKLIEDDLKN